MRNSTKYVWNAERRWPIEQEIDAAEADLWQFDFGQTLGMIAFGQWYPGIRPGHQIHQKTYDFPIRLEFIERPFAPPGREAEWYSWNLPEFLTAARALEAAGARAIVTGCGLLGSIQTELAAAVGIPVFSSTLQLIPLLHNALPPARRIGVLTVSEEFLRRWDNAAFVKCGVLDHDKLIVTGISESPYVDTWWTQFSDLDFDPGAIEALTVELARQMLRDNPDLGALVLECTELTPYKAAVQRAIRRPVLDAVDLVHHVYRMVG